MHQRPRRLRQRPKNTEATIFGAMLLAALSSGLYRTLDELAATWSSDRRFEPQLSRDRAVEMYAGWLAARKLTEGWTTKVPVA
jgi:glycerol kinase